MPRYIVLDKSILHGTPTHDLCRFVETHDVILSDALFYECLTTEKQKNLVLDRCRQAVLSGAFFCPSPSSVIFAEARDLRPYPSLVDVIYSEAVRRSFRDDMRPYDDEVLQQRSTQERGFVDHIWNNMIACAEYSKANGKTLEEEEERWGDDIDGSRLDRFRDRLQMVDGRNLHDVGNVLFSGITCSPEGFCLSEQWFTWQFTRVFWVWFLERAFLHQARGRMRRHDLEHDWADMSYVALLSRVDGVLMRDDFWRDLAHAMFPEKRVFGKLEDVPESYRCDWAGA